MPISFFLAILLFLSTSFSSLQDPNKDEIQFCGQLLNGKTINNEGKLVNCQGTLCGHWNHTNNNSDWWENCDWSCWVLPICLFLFFIFLIVICFIGIGLAWTSGWGYGGYGGYGDGYGRSNVGIYHRHTSVNYHPSRQ